MRAVGPAFEFRVKLNADEKGMRGKLNGLHQRSVRRKTRDHQSGFGQNSPVDVYIVISAKEGAVKENIARKEADSLKMRAAMVEQTKEITKKELKTTCRLSTPYEPAVRMVLPEWDEMKNECT